MREIKFRGKRIDNGQWAYGYLQLSEDKKSAWICKSKEDDWTVKEQFPVVPETVGQYNGLKDKNGKEIYEGDIVESSHVIHDGGRTHKNVIEFIDYCWRLKSLGELWAADIPLGLYARDPQTIEVIGNIYENPELMEAA
ncbi:MAG: hypothetical protein K0Q73_5640 [Paenibacillus sp.]|jgi:uncharacterized phage protein (TIGR01671 family)|nr:hypothetical protein [Paenibacillus sp.]